MSKITDSLIIIPARGGSKGVPRKNIRLLNGKPLIYYTIEVARGISDDENICVSTDDNEIKEIVESIGLRVPFLRPAELASDTSGTYEVLLHVLEYHKNKLGRNYKKIILLQPTSPLRLTQHIIEANSLYHDNLDMVVSVCESKANPYFSLFEEDSNGYLIKSKEGNYLRRQDAPKVFEYNGSIYIINIKSLLKQNLHSFKKIVKYLMPWNFSIDIDEEIDLKLAEILLTNTLGQK